jgi:hypothetical protein
MGTSYREQCSTHNNTDHTVGAYKAQSMLQLHTSDRSVWHILHHYKIQAAQQFSNHDNEVCLQFFHKLMDLLIGNPHFNQ